MLLSSHHFHGTPLMSLQTGTMLARVDEALINPRSLTVVAYYVEGPNLDVIPAVIRIEDIREIGEIGFIIDSSDDITSPEDIIRLQEIVDLQFEIAAMKVVDERGHTLGKVLDYNMDSLSFEIRQLRVKPSLLKMLNVSELLIHRDQIVKITNDRIIVKSNDKKKPVPSKAGLEPRPYANPFRTPQPESSPIDR
jgi:uncharacterized protein YrrD